MAKQTGAIIIEGTIDDITFYKMDGKGYARSKSSLKGARVKQDPRFRRTMQSAHRFGRGNQLASKVYRSLPREEQVYGLFQELKRIAVLALKEGKMEAAVVELLQQHLGRQQKQPTVICSERKDRPPGLKQNPRLFRVYGGRLKQTTVPARVRTAERRRSQRWVARCRKRPGQGRKALSNEVRF